VAWWGVTVRGDGRPPKNGFSSETVLSEAKAKKLTGIGKVQKHRMAIRLKGEGSAANSKWTDLSV
jgi:hypothetical protein